MSNPDLKHGKILYHLLLSNGNIQFLAKGMPETGMMVGDSNNGTRFCLSYNPGRGVPEYFKDVSGMGLCG